MMETAKEHRIPPESVRATVMANALWPIFMAWREKKSGETAAKRQAAAAN